MTISSLRALIISGTTQSKASPGWENLKWAKAQNSRRIDHMCFPYTMIQQDLLTHSEKGFMAFGFPASRRLSRREKKQSRETISSHLLLAQ